MPGQQWLSMNLNTQKVSGPEINSANMKLLQWFYKYRYRQTEKWCRTFRCGWQPSKFFTRPVLSQRSNDAGIVTMWFTLIRGIQKLSVSCTLVKGHRLIRIIAFCPNAIAVYKNRMKKNTLHFPLNFYLSTSLLPKQWRVRLMLIL